ncbi:MAG: dimethylmenaquinone methyltransferase [Haloarculaceae archaeon]
MTDLEYPLSDEEREEIMDLYDGLRVTDVVDGLDFNGYHDIGQVSKEIRPLYRDMSEFSHRCVGFANTMRMLPTNEPRDLPRPSELDEDTFGEWMGDWYGRHFGAPDVRENDVVVVEATGIDVGNIGSENAFDWLLDGANGVVTNGGVRDTDEIIKQDIPTYYKTISKPIIPGRDELDAVEVPVNLDGTKVEPGDVVVADGDGVVVVPLAVARDVGEAANRVQSADQETREEYYEEAGLEPDFTLE